MAQDISMIGAGIADLRCARQGEPPLVLLTGATGYVGGRLLKALELGGRVEHPPNGHFRSRRLLGPSLLVRLVPDPPAGVFRNAAGDREGRGAGGAIQNRHPSVGAIGP